MSKQKSAISNSSLKRIITAVLAVILLVLCAMVVVKAMELRRMGERNPPPMTHVSPEDAMNHTAPGGIDLGRLLSDPTAAVQTLPTGMHELDHEPADLPIPPNSEILLRCQAASNQADPAFIGQQICVRVLRDTTIESAASFYRQSLHDSHWSFDETVPQPMVLRMLASPSDQPADQPPRSLLIRLHQVGSEVRVVIGLR